jgi:low affinity Fe/Cu permease
LEYPPIVAMSRCEVLLSTVACMPSAVAPPDSPSASAGKHPPPSPGLRERFNRIADWLTVALGSFPALAGSVLLVVVWAMSGPLFNFSDTWQLFINTTTTVVTFWMVFVIQNSANRAAKATQLKLDELIRSLEGARNDFIALDKATEDVLTEHEEEFDQLAKGEISDVQADA